MILAILDGGLDTILDPKDSIKQLDMPRRKMEPTSGAVWGIESAEVCP